MVGRIEDVDVNLARRLVVTLDVASEQRLETRLEGKRASGALAVSHVSSATLRRLLLSFARPPSLRLHSESAVERFTSVDRGGLT
jgi:hypothetical protein